MLLTASVILDWSPSHRSPRKQSNSGRFAQLIRHRAADSIQIFPRGPVTDDDDSALGSDNDTNWDDDATLMALLDDPDELVDNDKTTIVDRLRPVFVSHRLREKEYIKQVFLQAIQNTKHVHTAIEEDISIRFLQAVSIFDNKSRHAEDAGRREQQGAFAVYDEIKACYLKSLIELFYELQDLADEQEVQFRSLKEMIGSLVRELRQRAADLLDDVEGVISALDKKARQLSAEDDARAKEKLLRGILEKY
ncbi:hypothetical protein J3A83DRAFT_4374059 [Scleroderma citrinum]